MRLDDLDNSTTLESNKSHGVLTLPRPWRAEEVRPPAGAAHNKAECSVAPLGLILDRRRRMG